MFNNPHAYMTHSNADLQMANPKNPHIKPKSGNMPFKPGFQSQDGPTGEATGKVGNLEAGVSQVTGKGFDVNPGPKGLGLKFSKLAGLMASKNKHTNTSY